MEKAIFTICLIPFMKCKHFMKTNLIIPTYNTNDNKNKKTETLYLTMMNFLMNFNAIL